MIERIIELSTKNKFLVIFFTLAAAVWSIVAMKQVPLDAIPDLSDTQVIILSRWDQSPDIIEDQVTTPIVTALLGAPHVQDIRGFSDFGFSFIYVIFEDGTDIYWARSRVLEYLSKIQPLLPDGVRTEMGPDATGVGWVYQYALVDKTGQNDLSQLRSFQDWYLRTWLQSVPGVAEVASIGGFQKQYQVNINPNALVATGVPLMAVVDAIRDGNNDVGGRLLEFAETEYMVRGRGYITGLDDIANIVVGRDKNGTPVLVKNVGRVTIGPDIRRGVADLDGQGDTVGGIIIMRHGENALSVIERVKTKIEEVKGSFPEGVELLTTYDRSDLINNSIATIKRKLFQEMLAVSLIIFIFLWHVRSALVPVTLLPLAALFSFLPMSFLGLTSNIMSLGGIAIAIGAMVDAAIILVENAHKRLEEWEAGGRKENRSAILLHSAQEVGRPIFFSLLVIAVSFMPIFTLQAQEGRMFRPLAFTKNFSMFFAAILAVTLGPVLTQIFLRPVSELRLRPKWLSRMVNFVWAGKIQPEERHVISRFLFRIYEPVLTFVLKRPKTIVLVAFLVALTSVPVFRQLGKEFMPPLYEGDLLYMPTTLPGITVTEAQNLMQTMDKLLIGFPEVDRVFGKAGRAETSTDPAPLSMLETTVLLKPMNEWRSKDRWYSSWMPERLKPPLRLLWPDRISKEELIDELDAALRFPGVTNAWTMPIKARIDMITTGIRTPIGIKIFGSDLGEIERVGAQVETLLRDVPGTRSVFAERTVGGYFVDFELKRDQLARHGLSIKEAQMVLMSAVGGETVTTTVEGRERYSVNVRYARELRDTLPKLRRVLVPTMSGAHVPLAQLAEIKVVSGPAMIRNENGMLSGYVYVDLEGRDVGSYVREAKALVEKEIKLPTGTYLSWSGQFEFMERVRKRMALVIPSTLIIIFLLLYLGTRSAVKTSIILLAMPFAWAGAFWLLYLLDYNMSVAVWVGLIALAGVDVETGVQMLLYLDLSYDRRVREGKMNSPDDLKDAVLQGAVKRIRPKMMTVITTVIALLPIMFAATHESGADVMKRIAAPMVGGVMTSLLGELLIYPAVYLLWKKKRFADKRPTATDIAL